MHPVVRGAIGVVIGVGLAASGVWLGGDSSPATDATAPTTALAPPTGEAVAEPEWVPGGVRFESTVIVPTAWDVGDGAARLDYELVALGAGPGISGFGFGPAEIGLVGALPESWRLTLVDGTVREAVTGPPPVSPLLDAAGGNVEASVGFTELPDDATRDDVAHLVVTGWRVAAPLRIDLEISAEVGSVARLPDGATVVLDGVIEQRTGSIIDFDVDAIPDPWRAGERSPFGRSTRFEGIGPGWISASSTIGGTGLSGGATGFQLRWNELEIPDPIVFRYRTVAWLATEAETQVIAGTWP